VFGLTEKTKKNFAISMHVLHSKRWSEKQQNPKWEISVKSGGKRVAAENKTSIFMRQFIAFPPLFTLLSAFGDWRACWARVLFILGIPLGV